MCSPGISPAKSDSHLAAEYRRHIRAARSIRSELESREYKLEGVRNGNIVKIAPTDPTLDLMFTRTKKEIL